MNQPPANIVAAKRCYWLYSGRLIYYSFFCELVNTAMIVTSVCFAMFF